MNINYKLMQNICLAPIKDFRKLGQVTDTKDGIYIYRDNPKAKILAIAHLDTVVKTNHFHHVEIDKDQIVINAQLDDRLGAYIILDLLPQLGIEYDLLLTVGEEQGKSTAYHFETDKQYNWMFSFDRRGNDVVMYQYDTKELRDDLQSVKLRPSVGTFSDIAFLDHLGIRGMNIGTGYYGEHSTMSYANMSVMNEQVTKFKAFYGCYQNKRYDYTYTPTPSKPLGRPSYAQAEWNDTPWYKNIPDMDCYLCSNEGAYQVQNDIWLCEECFNDAGKCTKCQDIFEDIHLVDGLCIDCRGGS